MPYWLADPDGILPFHRLVDFECGRDDIHVDFEPMHDPIFQLGCLISFDEFGHLGKIAAELCAIFKGPNVEGYLPFLGVSVPFFLPIQLLKGVGHGGFILVGEGMHYLVDKFLGAHIASLFNHWPVS